MTKSKGALIFARNNAQIDYIKQAHYLAKRIKKYLDIPTTIVTDSIEYLKNEYKDYKEVFDQVNKIANEAHKILQYKQDTKQICIDAWINDYGSYNISMPHQHPTADLAIVYFPYAQEGCGNLQLLNPNSKLQYVIHDEMVASWNNYNSFTWDIVPKTGKVVVFPGYLIHYVKQNKLNKQRVSIAFNYRASW